MNKTMLIKELKSIGYWISVLIFSIICVYLAFRGVDWAAFTFNLRKANLNYICIAFLIVTFSFVLRAVRWRTQLSMEEKSIRFRQTFWAVSAGYLLNNFVPARAGDLFRSIILAKEYGLSKTCVFSTTLAEKIVDLIMLVSICSVTLVFLSKIPEWIGNVYGLVTIFFVFGVVLIFGLFFRRVIFSWIEKIPLLNRFSIRIKDIFQKVILGVRSFTKPKFVFLYLSFSILIWFFDALSALSIAAAFQLKVNFTHIILLFTALGFASSLPSTPGYIGIYQIVAITVLVPFGFLKEQALVFILSLQGVSYLVSIVWGGIALVKYFIISKIVVIKEDYLKLS